MTYALFGTVAIPHSPMNYRHCRQCARVESSVPAELLPVAWEIQMQYCGCPLRDQTKGQLHYFHDFLVILGYSLNSLCDAVGRATVCAHVVLLPCHMSYTRLQQRYETWRRWPRNPVTTFRFSQNARAFVTFLFRKPAWHDTQMQLVELLRCGRGMLGLVRKSSSSSSRSM